MTSQISSRSSYDVILMSKGAIGMSFCQGTKHNSVALVIDLWRHLTHNSRGAWHTVYAMLLSNYEWEATWNSYNFLKPIIHSPIMFFFLWLPVCFPGRRNSFKMGSKCIIRGKHWLPWEPILSLNTWPHAQDNDFAPIELIQSFLSRYIDYYIIEEI